MYDSLGYLKEVAKYRFNEDGSINSSIVESYNEKGLLTETKEFYHWKVCNYSSDVHKSWTHKKFEYFQNGLLAKVYFLNAREEIDKIIEYIVTYKE